MRRQLELPNGLRLAKPSRSGHVHVLDEAGEPLRMPSGIPIKVSVSPSDWRTQKNELARIRRALEARP